MAACLFGCVCKMCYLSVNGVMSSLHAGIYPWFSNEFREVFLSLGSSSVDETKNQLKEKVKDTVGDESPLKKHVGKGLAKRKVLSKGMKRSGGPKKTLRCKKCIGCLTAECGVCAACK